MSVKAKTEEGQEMALAYIAADWVTRLMRGEIRYDPSKVASRWVTAPSGNSLRWKMILNRHRKDRPEKKAA